MPCTVCGDSAKKHGGACVNLRYDEDGMARYTCLSCVKETMEKYKEEND